MHRCSMQACHSPMVQCCGPHWLWERLRRGSGTVQRLGRGLECNGSMAIMWAGLACMQPREKSKGLGGMVRLEACVQSVVGEDGPLSVRFRWSKTARACRFKDPGCNADGPIGSGGGGGVWGYFATLGKEFRMQCNHGNHLEQPCRRGALGKIKGPGRNGTV